MRQGGSAASFAAGDALPEAMGEPLLLLSKGVSGGVSLRQLFMAGRLGMSCEACRPDALCVCGAAPSSEAVRPDDEVDVGVNAGGSDGGGEGGQEQKSRGREMDNMAVTLACISSPRPIPDSGTCFFSE